MQKNSAGLLELGDKKISDAIILPGRFKRIYVDEGHGKIFIGGKQIYELDPSNKKFLSASRHENLDEISIKQNTILITRSGTIGKVALVPKHWENWAMTHDIIRLVSNDEVMGYIYIWLRSDYASTILKSFSYGAVVQHIEKEHFESMPIPLLKRQSAQKKINALALEANAKRFEAYNLEQQALKIISKDVIDVL